MALRLSLSRRDAILLLLGVSMAHIWSIMSYGHGQERLWTYTTTPSVPSTKMQPQTATTTTTFTSKPSVTCTNLPFSHANVAADLPHTSVIAHAPGWTLFRDLYMSNGTLYILSSNRSFPEIRMMTSTGLPAQNTLESIALREPTPSNMDYLTPEEALARWGGDVERGEKNRVWSVDGNTVNGSNGSGVY